MRSLAVATVFTVGLVAVQGFVSPNAVRIAHATAPACKALAAQSVHLRPQFAAARCSSAAVNVLQAGAADDLPSRLEVEAKANLKATKIVKVADADDNKGGLTKTIKVGVYFGLWYLLNIGYNIYNKTALNMLPLPWLMASMQLGVGALYFLPLWATGLRKAPKLAKGSLKNLTVLGLLHSLAHITAVLSLGAGAVSFTHIVKAAEPVFTAGFSGLILGQFFPFPVYLSLLPVVGGVALASMKELTFSWMAFGNAMGSNTFSALRGIMGKKQMGSPVGENMNAANLYAVLTLIAFAFLAPAALAVEGGRFSAVWSAALAQGYTKKVLTSTMLLSGLFYYLYNEVAFLALESVHPVTHAVGNTIKRVVIIISSVIAFRTPMSQQSILGSAIAIGGTLLYSLVKQSYDAKKKPTIVKIQA